MTTNHYKTLGLLPGAEDAVIRAAYRALMRIYHPDTNTTLEAQERARAIAAAYAVLGDPAARAAYDDEIGLIESDYPAEGFSERPRAKPLRAAGLASIGVAVASVFLLFSWERPNQIANNTGSKGQARGVIQPHEAALVPPSETIAPPGERLPANPAPQAIDIDPMLQPAPIVEAKIAPLPKAPAQVRTVVEMPKPREIASARQITSARTAPAVPRSPDQLAKVESIATGFFDQSWAHANAAKQKLLLASRDRAFASRKLCRSDQCVTAAYLRQMRETSAIMEGRPLPSQ